MEEENPKTSPFALPPGCRFHPSEEQLLGHYLAAKNAGNEKAFGFDLIGEIDLYKYEPFELPERACFWYGFGGRKRHWYCYARVGEHKEERGGRRRATNGYWKSKGRVCEVVGKVGGGGRLVLGTKRSFVFYLGDLGKGAVRTDWVMREYALVDHHQPFVLCRIFVKSRCGNNLSDHVLSSCAEESVSAVRHVGIQHDGMIVTSDIHEGKAHDDYSVDRKNEISSFPVRLISELDDQVTTEPVDVAGFQFPSGIHPNEPVRSSGLTLAGSRFVDALSDQQLISIEEEDFIELDDLICPLLGTDNSG